MLLGEPKMVCNAGSANGRSTPSAVTLTVVLGCTLCSESTVMGNDVEKHHAEFHKFAKVCS